MEEHEKAGFKSKAEYEKAALGGKLMVWGLLAAVLVICVMLAKAVVIL